MTDPPVESLLAQRLTRPESVDVATLRAEYQVAVDFIKVLTDIRFRCLAFVTATAAVANALLPGAGRPGLRIALGSLGFFTTVGIVVYELRNSQLYEAAIHRAKVLEKRLRGDASSADSDKGLFNERPLYVKRADDDDNDKKTLMRFWLVPVKHDHGSLLGSSPLSLPRCPCGRSSTTTEPGSDRASRSRHIPRRRLFRKRLAREVGFRSYIAREPNE